MCWPAGNGAWGASVIARWGAGEGCITLLRPSHTFLSAVELPPCQAKLCRASPIGVGSW